MIFEDRPWGRYTILDTGPDCQVKRVGVATDSVHLDDFIASGSQQALKNSTEGPYNRKANFTLIQTHC